MTNKTLELDLGPTIPRLELCAEVLAVELAELIIHEIELQLDAITCEFAVTIDLCWDICTSQSGCMYMSTTGFVWLCF